MIYKFKKIGRWISYLVLLSIISLWIGFIDQIKHLNFERQAALKQHINLQQDCATGQNLSQKLKICADDLKHASSCGFFQSPRPQFFLTFLKQKAHLSFVHIKNDMFIAPIQIKKNLWKYSVEINVQAVTDQDVFQLIQHLLSFNQGALFIKQLNLFHHFETPSFEPLIRGEIICDIYNFDVAVPEIP